MNIHIYIYDLIIYICNTIFVCKSTVTLVQKKVNSIDMSLNPGHCEYYHVPVLTWKKKWLCFLFLPWDSSRGSLISSPNNSVFVFSKMFGLERWLGTSFKQRFCLKLSKLQEGTTIEMCWTDGWNQMWSGWWNHGNLRGPTPNATFTPRNSIAGLIKGQWLAS